MTLDHSPEEVVYMGKIIEIKLHQNQINLLNLIFTFSIQAVIFFSRLMILEVSLNNIFIEFNQNFDPAVKTMLIKVHFIFKIWQTS
jgi:hypothetical protein